MEVEPEVSAVMQCFHCASKSCMCWRSLECGVEYLSSRWQVNCTYCCGSGKG